MKIKLLFLFLLMSVSSQAQTSFFISEVNNLVKIGKMAGNRNLAFGVKNILEEYLQENNYLINPESEQGIKVDIIYLDMLTTSSNLSVFHKSNAQVVVRLKGYLINKNNTIIKTSTAQQSASEISMSTLVIDTGGKLNQQNLSTAIKKSCEQLVTSLLKP